MALVTEEIKSKAEVYYGDELGQQKSKELLKEIGMPNGLLPLKDIKECDYLRETGFVWLKQKKSSTHKFEKIGKPPQSLYMVLDTGSDVNWLQCKPCSDCYQ